jgi:hypothetical protein
MEDIYINRNCKYYDYGRTAPREYGAFCEKKKCGIESANCKDCDMSSNLIKARYSVEFKTAASESITIAVIEATTNILRKTMTDLGATDVMPKFEIMED